MALRPCLAPGCSTLVKGGRCPEHQAKRTATLNAEDVRYRGTSVERGYDAAWKRLRDGYVRLQPFCELCIGEGKVPPFLVGVPDINGITRLVNEPVVVDHVVPHRGDDGLRLDSRNLQTLCHSHHRRKTMAEGEGYRAPKGAT